jgi:hypothetical protein
MHLFEQCDWLMVAAWDVVVKDIHAALREDVEREPELITTQKHPPTEPPDASLLHLTACRSSADLCLVR